MKLADLRRAIEEGYESGLPAPWNLEEFKAKARDRLEARQRQ